MRIPDDVIFRRADEMDVVAFRAFPRARSRSVSHGDTRVGRHGMHTSVIEKPVREIATRAVTYTTTAVTDNHVMYARHHRE